MPFARAHDYSLSDSFWRAFTATVWNRKPVVFRQPFASPIATENEVYDALLNQLSQQAADPDRDAYENLSFHIDNARLQSGLRRYLPQTSDRSLARYAARMQQNLKGRFGLTAGNFHIPLGWDAWNRFRKFLSGLYRHAGVPGSYAEAVLFLGNYENSPQGVHLDDADVFCFVVSGRKRIRLWPARTFSGHPKLTRLSRREYSPHLASSICLDGEPGDVLYWPASYWHVGESSGGVDASISLALHYGDNLPRRLNPAFAQIVGDAVSHVTTSHTPRYRPGDSSREDAIVKIVARETTWRNLRMSLERTRLESKSAFGFSDTLPGISGPGLDSNRTLRVDPRLPIEYKRLGREMIVAVAGRSFVMPFTSQIRSLFDTLNVGEQLLIKDIFRKYCIPPKRKRVVRVDRRALHHLLSILQDAGAFVPAAQ